MVNQFPFIFTLLTGLTLCWADPSFAQQGKNEYTQAIALFEAEEFEAALPFFEKAYQLSEKRPSTILGLAQCERALKLYEKAIVHFEEFLKTKPEKEQGLRVEETLRLTRIIVTSKIPIKTKTPDKSQSASSAEKPLLATSKGEPDTIWTNPWIWVLLGSVVIGGSIGTAYAIQGETEAYRGNTNIALQPLTPR